MRKFARCLEKWGHYLLAGVCAAVILLSALWTRNQQVMEIPDSLAISDQSQHLREGTPKPDSAACVRPMDGPVLAPYSETPVYDDTTGVWQAHPWVDFSAPPGEPVRAMLPGEVIRCQGEVAIDHGDGAFSRYRGLGTVSVHAGQTVQAGDRIGAAGQAPVSVALQRCGVYAPFGQEWLDNSPKISYNENNDQR